VGESFATIMRNGTNASSAIASFTPQSATASDTQSGITAPWPSSGMPSQAHEIASSLPAPNSVTEAEKAMVKNSAVSTADPMKVDASGAFHHAPPRRRSKIETSKSWAVRNAIADATAMRSGTAGPYSSMICDPISEHTMPTKNPANTTRRAADTP